MKKATLEDLIARKAQADKARMMIKEIEVPALDMVVTVEKLPLARILGLIDKYKDVDTLSNKFEMYKELIYMSVPIFRNQELQAVYEVAEPTDIITILFEQNLLAITKLGDEISDMYGLNDGSAVAELKN